MINGSEQEIVFRIHTLFYARLLLGQFLLFPAFYLKLESLSQFLDLLFIHFSLNILSISLFLNFLLYFLCFRFISFKSVSKFLIFFL